jgi:hypothetical protein
MVEHKGALPPNPVQGEHMKEHVHSETGGIIGKVLFFGLAGLIMMGVASSALSAGEPTTERRPGSSAVYAAIASASDCEVLQEHFDHGVMTNKRGGYVPTGPAFAGAEGARWSKVGLGYMDAADGRMREIGCYR